MAGLGVPPLPDVLIHDHDGDGPVVVEFSVPVGARKRRFLVFEAEDFEDAKETAEVLLKRAQRACNGDALDAILGVGLLDNDA